MRRGRHQEFPKYQVREPKQLGGQGWQLPVVGFWVYSRMRKERPRVSTVLEDYTGGRDLPSLQKFAQAPREILRQMCIAKFHDEHSKAARIVFDRLVGRRISTCVMCSAGSSWRSRSSDPAQEIMAASLQKVRVWVPGLRKSTTGVHGSSCA